MLDEITDFLELRGNDFSKIEEGFTIEKYFGIKINLDSSIETIIIEKNEEKNDLELKEFFRERVFYSMYINSNKAVSIKSFGKKIIMSHTADAIIFNYETFFKKIKELKDKGTITEDKDIKWLLKDTILSFFEALDTKENVIRSNLDIIVDLIIQQDPKGYKVAICINKSIDDYKEKFEVYMKDKIFDKKGGIGEYSPYSSFSTIQSKKPLLIRVGLTNSNNILYTKDEGIEIYKTYEYASKNFGIKNNIDGRYISWNPKDKEFIDIEYNPYILAKEKKINFILKNYLELKGLEEKSITSYSKIINSINKYIGFALSKPKLETKETKLKILVEKYKKIVDDTFIKENEEGKHYIHVVNKNVFRDSLERLMKDVINYNRLNKSLGYILNLKINLEDYFLNKKEGGNIVELKERFKNKILNLKNTEKLESREEAMFAAGQLASYLSSKTKGDKFHQLVANYNRMSTYRQISHNLGRDMEKYSHEFKGMRESRIFSLIKSFFLSENLEGKLEVKDRDLFLIGLYAENLLYIKSEKDTKLEKGDENNGEE